MVDHRTPVVLKRLLEVCGHLTKVLFPFMTEDPSFVIKLGFLSLFFFDILYNKFQRWENRFLSTSSEISIFPIIVGVLITTTI